MKKRTSNVSRRIVSLLMSMVLTLTLVTPVAFAEGDMLDNGQQQEQQEPTDAGNGGSGDVSTPAGGKDSEDKNTEDKNTEDGKDEQRPADPGDEGKDPGEGEDDVNASSNEADTQEGEGTDTPVVAQRTVTLEKWNKNAAYDVKIVILAAASEPGEGETTEAPGEGENAGSGNETLSDKYTGTDEKITLKLTTEDYKEAIYIKSSADEVVAETTPKLGDDGTLEYVFTGEETDITLYYGTQEDFVSGWYGDGKADNYTIRSAEELAYFAQLVNGTVMGSDGKTIEAKNFSTNTVTLARDIDLSTVCGEGIRNWTPIGNDASHAFAGKFDGNGHTIEKLYINESSVWTAGTSLYKGLFGNNSGVIQNVTVKGDVIVNNTGNSTSTGVPRIMKAVGGIVGFNNRAGKVQNCGFYGTVRVQGNNSKGETKYSKNNSGGVVGTGNAANCWYYTPWVDGNNVLGVCWGTPTYCYHNVPKASKGTFIKSESFGGFAAAAADRLNAYAFENKLPMWSASESALVIDMELKYDAVVKLAAGVDGSVVAGKVGFGNNLAQSKLGKNNEPLVLTVAEGTGKVCYTLKKPTEGVTITKDDLVELPAEYTVNAENADEKGVITLYYGTEDELMADLTESGWYYNNTKGDYYSISTSKELRFLATLVNDKHINFSGKTINLTKNIDLSDIEDWTPIGKDTDLPFAGKFNGAGSSYSISGLNGDLFGVVKGSIESVNISGVTGRLVGTLESGGTVKNCMSTAKAEGSDENAAVGGLVGTAVEGATVSSSYYYNKDSMGTRVVGSGKATNCFYLAETSTFGDAEDNGARTAEEFAAGRVTWELNGKANGFKGRGTYLSWGMSDNEPKVPKLARIKVGAPGCVYELTLTKVYAPPAKDIRLEGGEGVTVFQNGDTWYAYCVLASNKTFSVKVDTTTLESGDMVTYGTNGEPTKITRIEASAEAAKNAYFYTIGGKIEADIDWYVGHENEDTYILKNAAEMFGFAALVNGTAKDKDGKEIPSKGFDGKTVELANDIDLSNCPWTPIGFTDSIVFQGTFNGGGHRVKGLLVAANIRYAGLFGRLKGAGTVRNVQVEGSVDATYTSGGTFYVGGIVGQLAGSGTVSNCLSKVDVTATSSNNAVSAGGVVGDAVSGSKINLCWNEGSVQVTGVVVGSAVGGVVGSAATATNCANFGAVTSNCATGGIAGSINEASNCYNLGTVTGAEGKTHNISNGTVVNSYYADIAGKTGIYVNNGSDTTKADTTEITITEEENGKLTYKVTMDSAASDLVEVLNDNTPTAANIEKWINKLSTPYNPVHMTRWDGNPEPGAQEGVVSITYDPGTATVGTAVSDSKLLKEEEASWTFTLKTADDLGFKHENGTFLGWSTQSDAAVPEYTFGGEAPTITVTKEQKNVILYAVWKDIWSGSGSEADPYLIPSTEKLKALQTQVNDKGFNYKGKYFALTPENKTIALTGKWTPIGNGNTSFGGSIEGNGTTITGLQVSEEWYAGLFRLLGVDGTSTYIRNLTISGDVTAEKGHAGGLTAIVGNGTITLENITTEVTVTSHGDANYALPFGSAGGLIGYNVANNGAAYNVVKVINCTNKGNISGATAGGIAGANNDPNAASQYTLEDCTNKGSVTGLLYAGGILGGSTNSTATRCENSGTVKATGTTGTRGYAGGICATNLRWAKRCVNTGEVCGQYAGGIAYGLSSTYGGEAKYCLNKGNITGTRIAAGIVAYGKSEDISGIGGISFSYNLGKVTADAGKGAAERAYGIASSGNIKNCFTYNEAKHVAISASNELVTNSYYLADSAGEFSTAYGGEWASADDFASGKVAWGVGGKGEGSQGGTGQDAQLGWWKQDKDDKYPTLLPTPDMSKRYYRTDVDCGTGGEVELTRNASNTVKELSSKEAVYGPAGTSVTIKATPKDNTFGLKSLTWTHNGQTDVLPTKGTTNIVMPAESNVTIRAEFASVGGGGGGYYYGGSGDGTGTGDKDDEGLQDGLNMDVEYNIKGLVLGAYAEWGANGGNKSFQKWLEENPNVVRALLTNSLDNMATAAVGKKTDEAKDLAALLLASLNEHTGVDSKDGDTIAKALQKYIGSGSEEVFSAWLTGGGGMASGTYESIYGQYASSLAALADRLYSKWEASGTSMTFPVWLDAQQVSMDSLSENAEEPDTDSTNDPQTSDAPDDVPDGQDTEGGASGNSVWEIIGTVVRENPIIVWSIVAVIAALIIVGAVRRYHKVKRDERDEK